LIKIVGLGPSTIDEMSVGAYRTIRCAPIVFVRTAHHPAALELAAEGISMEAMDGIYESADTFEEVYSTIAERILGEAEIHPEIVYAVPGHPLVGEIAVRIILRKARDRGVEVEVVGSPSFLEASLESVGRDLDEGLKIIDALSMGRVSPDTDSDNLIYQVYDRRVASETKLRLMERYPDDFEIAMIFGGSPKGERARWMPLYMMDRCDCDHLTSAYIPAIQAPTQA